MSRTESVAAVVVLIVVGVVARALPHMPNFAPITASALFCGAYISRRYSLPVVFVTLAAGDYIMLYVNPFGATSFDHVYAPWDIWHSTLVYVYLSFAISALVGWYVRSHRQPGLVVLAALFCSVQFFLITNAGVWLAGAYDRGLDGLIQSYTAGLPFFRGTVLGDLFYTAVFFGGYELVKRAEALAGRRAVGQRMA
jgi:Family of unknown function (DUF6580)